MISATTRPYRSMSRAHGYSLRERQIPSELLRPPAEGLFRLGAVNVPQPNPLGPAAADNADCVAAANPDQLGGEVLGQ
jgi:hypothetical protein